MQAKTRHRFARISATKVRRVACLIRRQPLPRALDLLRVNVKRPARVLEKALKSAWANAIDQGGRLDEADFLVAAARVDEGPRLKRIRAGDRGRARRILKRSCHITIVISDEED